MIKIALKHRLSRFGILPHVDSLRRLAETNRWIENGCTGVAPPPVKRKILMAYLRTFSLTQFIETGTYLGDTLAYIARDKRIQCSSIELADRYFQDARDRFAAYPNVKLFHGDSGALLPDLVRQLKSPALFWLDGHYSGGETARSVLDTPISAELHSILESPVRNHVVLVDDVRCFDGKHGYPFLDELLKTVRE